jgi:hypothetical protein
MVDNKMDETEFECHDIYLAAYLSLSSCKLIRRRRQGQRVYFVFTNPGGSVTAMREAYYSGSGVVVANEFANAIKNAKEMLFD